jgi:cytochrome c553
MQSLNQSLKNKVVDPRGRARRAASLIRLNGERIMRIIIVVAASLLLGVASLRAADAKENWEKNCVSCHGKDGKGETKAGKKAGVKDLTDANYQNSLTDEKMAQQIKGGMKEGGKEKMKPFGDKLSDEEIKALIGYVRAFKK